MAGAGGIGEEGLEGGGDSAFVEGVLVLEFFEGGVVLVEEFFVRVFGGLWGAGRFGGGLGHDLRMRTRPTRPWHTEEALAGKPPVAQDWWCAEAHPTFTDVHCAVG